MEYPVLLVAFLLLVAATSYIRFRDPLYPPVMQSLVWALMICLFVLNRSAFYRLSGNMYALIGIGAFAFALGSYVATYGLRPEHRVWRYPALEADWLRVALLAIAVAGLPFFVRRAYQLAAGGPTGSLLFDLRFAMGRENREFGLLSYLVPFAIVTAGVHLLVAPSKRLQTALAIVVAAAYAVLTTGRTAAFALVILLIGIQLTTRRLKVKHGAIAILACASVFFVLVAFVQRKGLDPNASLAANVATLGENVRVYALSSIPAMDSILKSDPSPALGVNTFRFFLALGSAVGIDDLRVVPVIYGYTKVPVPTNVYTVYYPYFVDFLFPGAVMIQVVFGLLHGIAYRRATCGDPMFICLFSLLLYALLLQPFNDQYVNALSMWVQYAVVLWVYFRVPGLLGARPTPQRA